MSQIHYFILFFFLFSCRKKETLFESVKPQETGITFANRLQETEQENVLTYEYFYNGGGVAAGDVNNDGLVDLFFTGNQVNNALYLNKGGLKFEDVSMSAGVAGRKGGWKTGVSLVDINADGWLDVYVCYSGPNPPAERKNQLFINTTFQSRKSSDSAPVTFREAAESYGLADPGYATQAAFFDYDGDGDLDMYLMNHNLRDYQQQNASVMRTARDEFAGDKLFRNDDEKFTDVTQQAGVKSNPLGFGLGLAVADINGDNLLDIYVGNDYVEDDYLYMNNGDGTFTDRLREKIAHTSRFTMGLDVADVNNDTLPDIFTLDMLPEDNQRQKLLTFPDNWQSYQSTLANGFWHQNMRNMLQMNNGNGTFSETGQLAGVSNTDWSWSALMADYDNDGWKDLFVSNGELKDLTNADFIKYAADEEMKKAEGKPYEALLNQIKNMPTSQTKHYIFRNQNGLQFENKQQDWGFDEPTVANGAAYADLDNDGDVDIVTNVNNGVARVYKNNVQELAAKSKQTNKHNFLRIKLTGSASNPFGVGAKVFLYGNKTVQYQEFSPVRGFQSCTYDALHVGLGNRNQPVNLKIIWPDGKQQIMEGVRPNQTLTVNYGNAQPSSENPSPAAPLFQEKPKLLTFSHQENPANDFNRQRLVPYQYSYNGVRMATGDMNGDGLDDVYFGGARNQAGAIFTGQPDGTFTPFSGNDIFQVDSTYEDKDAVFFDADGDKDLDLYVVSGDYGLTQNHPDLQDRLYRNDGNGNFTRDQTVLPKETLNGACVKVLDVDNDDDQDVFVGNTVVPGFYPVAEPSMLLNNNGNGTFTKQDIFLGMVSDVAIADLDKNGFPDIIAVGEWMSPTVLYNQQGKLAPNATLKTTTSLLGWWNRIAADDLDGDGDPDFVLGNLGLNSQMRASKKEPITIAFADFDQNGTLDPIMSYYIQGVSYPAIGRDEALEQVVSLRKKFTSYESFSTATIQDIFTKEQLKSANHMRIDCTETIVLENTGNDFVVHSLPIQAQYSPVYAIATDDFTGDGRKDILLSGNNATYRLRMGKMDANQGVLLAGTGKFQYRYVPQMQSGFRLSGDVKDVQRLRNGTLLFTTNNGPVQVYQPTKRTEAANPVRPASNLRSDDVPLKNRSIK